jgi:glucose/arabinose dehydrogenase
MQLTVKTAMLVASVLLCGCGGGGDGDGDGGDAPEPPTPAPQGPGAIQLERAFGDRSFTAPLGLLQAPGDNSRWFVVEQAGRVRDFAMTNAEAAATFIDISAQVASPATGDGGETGLLGMAFHPQYPAVARVFLSYTHRTAANGLVSRISEFAAVDAGNGRVELDPGSEQVLLTVAQPFANHNGGHILFGPDGLLYIGFGDGGSGGDPQNNAQRLNTLLGKLLRIDVDAGVPYSTPAGNPVTNGTFCGNGGSNGGADCGEIYAYGLRNPWRWTFDRTTGDLWLGDVGQGEWEEVDIIERGGNYGWRCREGAHEFNSSNCAGADLIEPVAEYGHVDGNISITGGYVYRGSQSSTLQGRYLFADFGSGRIWTAVTGTRAPRELLDTDLNIASFAQGNDGELYIVDLNGPLYRIVFE